MCGLSIPALYRYFPSKKAMALFPLVAIYPDLHAPPPDINAADPMDILSGWVDAAVGTLPDYTLALRFAREVGLSSDEQRKVKANLVEHSPLSLRWRAARPRPSMTGAHASSPPR